MQLFLFTDDPNRDLLDALTVTTDLLKVLLVVVFEILTAVVDPEVLLVAPNEVAI